jgi:hypothetical protein
VTSLQKSRFYEKKGKLPGCNRTPARPPPVGLPSLAPCAAWSTPRLKLLRNQTTSCTLSKTPNALIGSTSVLRDCKYTTLASYLQNVPTAYCLLPTGLGDTSSQTANDPCMARQCSAGRQFTHSQQSSFMGVLLLQHIIKSVYSFRNKKKI